MNELVQDVWHDLRTKRLWPVAALLVLGLVAIPAVMMKSATEPTAQTAPPPAPAEPDAPALADIEVVDEVESGAGSSLDRFSARNPFKPPSGVTSRGDEAVGANASATAGAADATGDVTGGGDPSGGDGGGGDVGEDGGDDGGGDSPASEPPPTTTVEFEYVVDVTFWNGNRRKRFPRLRKLDMLPNQAAPVLIFMGTTAKGGNAVFLVDSTLKATGEGRCVPSGANCAYVHVGPGSEHAFTTDSGDSYRLRVEEIRRVRLDGKAARAKASTPTARRLARTADVELEPFALPRLIDLVEVTGAAPLEAAGVEPGNGDGPGQPAGAEGSGASGTGGTSSRNESERR